jgi:hypothetical protein
MDLQEFKTLPADRQREVLEEMRAQVDARLQSALNEVLYHDELEAALVPKISFKTVAPEYPETPPLRQGIDQEEYVRRIFRSDPGIKELRTADGNVYTRK